MKNIKKLIAFVLTFSFALTMTACKDSKKDEDKKTDDTKVTSQYDKYLEEKNSTLLPEDYNPIKDSFTQTDFQFTKEDDTTAFNLCENSYTVMTPSHTAYYFYTSKDFAQKFDGAFKTCKAMTFTNTKKEVIDSYKAQDTNVYDIDNSCSVIAFASNGEFEYTILDKSLTGKIYSYVETTINNGLDTKEVLKIADGYTSLALLKIEADANGVLSAFTMYRFDKE